MTFETINDDFGHFLHVWEVTMLRASVLAARHPELGINPDNLHLETPEYLKGILKRLENHHDKVSSDGEQ